MAYRLPALFLIFLLSSLSAHAANWVDLMPLASRPTAVVAGQWNPRTANKQIELHVAAAQAARIQLPVETGQKYDFEVSFTRLSGKDSMSLMFPLNNQILGFELDAWGQGYAGFQTINGQDMRRNGTRSLNHRLTNQRRYTLRLQVRENRVIARLNGQPINRFTHRKQNLALLNVWGLPTTSSLGIGSWNNEVLFHQIRLRRLATKGRQKTSSKPRAARSPTAQNRIQRVIHADDLAKFSDEFDQPSSLGAWRRLYQTEDSRANQLQQISIRRGALTLLPYTSTWYNDWRGALLYKLVRGNFIATTHVRSTAKRSQRPPSRKFSLAGLMVRKPKPGPLPSRSKGKENYLFLSLGSADRPGNNQFEVKTTINSKSQRRISHAPSNTASLRIARIGNTFILLRKTGCCWKVHQRYRRQDMPKRLQVGMTVYTDWENAKKRPPLQHNQSVILNGRPDLRAKFEYFRFSRPWVPESLLGKDLSNPKQVSDRELLVFLGNDKQ